MDSNFTLRQSTWSGAGRRKESRSWGLAACAGTIVIGLVMLGGPAQAFDFAIKVEPGVAVPVSPPQSGYFKVGDGLRPR